MEEKLQAAQMLEAETNAKAASYQREAARVAAATAELHAAVNRIRSIQNGESQNVWVRGGARGPRRGRGRGRGGRGSRGGVFKKKGNGNFNFYFK